MKKILLILMVLLLTSCYTRVRVYHNYDYNRHKAPSYYTYSSYYDYWYPSYKYYRGYYYTSYYKPYYYQPYYISTYNNHKKYKTYNTNRDWNKRSSNNGDKRIIIRNQKTPAATKKSETVIHKRIPTKRKPTVRKHIPDRK